MGPFRAWVSGLGEGAARLWPRPGRTRLAWRNVTHDKTTMLVSTAAITFAVLVLFMELGFLEGLYDSQTALPRAVVADLFVVSRGRHLLFVRELFPRARLEQARSCPGVAAVSALYEEHGVSFLRNPETGVENAIRVLAFDPDEPVFAGEELRQLIPRLREPLSVLFDRRSRRFYGPVVEGTRLELGGRRVTVVGTYAAGADYYYDGTILASTDTFFTLFGQQHWSRPMLGLVRREPTARLSEVQQRLRRTLPPDVDVLTRDEIVAREEQGWAEKTPAGMVFGLGLVVGFAIGVIICYQILFADIANRLPQIATLKALGYRNADLVGVVVRQSLLLALFGFGPAVGLTILGYSALGAMTGIVMRMTVARTALVLALTLGMAVVSALLAVRKALATEPAELF